MLANARFAKLESAAVATSPAWTKSDFSGLVLMVILSPAMRSEEALTRLDREAVRSATGADFGAAIVGAAVTTVFDAAKADDCLPMSPSRMLRVLWTEGGGVKVDGGVSGEVLFAAACAALVMAVTVAGVLHQMPPHVGDPN